MNIESFKSRIKIVTYIIFGLIATSIFIRIVLRAFGASETAQFTIFWYDLTDYFVGSFEGIYGSINPRASRVVIETYSIVAFFVYIVLSIVTSRSLMSVTTNDSIQKTKDIASAFFKIMEFFLISRFLLMLTHASTASSFVRFVYSVSSVVSGPFNGIFPTYNFGESGVIFETSTLIAIVIIIVFDLLTDRLVDTIRKAPPVQHDNKPKPQPQTIPNQQNLSGYIPTAPTNQQQQYQPTYGQPNQNNGYQPQQYPSIDPTMGNNNYGSQPGMNNNYQQPQTPQPSSPQVQNFHFNIPNSNPTAPAQPQPTTYVDKRSVNVYPNGANNDNISFPGNQELSLESPHDMLINDADHNTPDSPNDQNPNQSWNPPADQNIPPLE